MLHTEKYYLGFVAIYLTVGVLSLSNVTCDYICDRLRDLPPKLDETREEFPILTFGSTAKQMWLITKGLLVYKLPLEAMDTVNHRLSLNNRNPFSFARKWPNLFDSLKNLHSSVVGSFMYGDQVDELNLYVMTNSNTSNMRIDFGKLEVNKDVTYAYDSGQTWISNGTGGLYGIGTSQNGVYLRSLAVQAKTLVRLIRSESWSICLSSTAAGDQVSLNPFKCNISVQWPIKRGFIINKFFYLFGSDRKVYIFPELSFNESFSDQVNLTTITFKQFFGCPPKQNDVTDEPINFTSSYSINPYTPKSGLIVAVIIFMMIALAICVAMTCAKSSDQYGPLEGAPNSKELTLFNKYISQNKPVNQNVLNVMSIPMVQSKKAKLKTKYRSGQLDRSIRTNDGIESTKRTKVMQSTKTKTTTKTKWSSLKGRSGTTRKSHSISASKQHHSR